MITDNFNRTTLGTDWQTTMGAAWTIASNRAKPVSTYAMTMMRRAEGNFPDDQYSQCQCQAILDRDNSLGGVAVRMDGSGYCYYAHLYSAGLLLYKRSSGGTQSLGFYSMGVTSGTYYLLKLVVTGGLLQVYVNGALVLSYTDPQPLGSGKPGLFANAGSTPPSFDDFECTDAIGASGGGGGSVARGALLGVG